MSQQLVLKAKGLSTHSNPLSAVPEGSLAEALNVVIDRNEIIEPRRGFSQYGNVFGNSTDRVKQLLNYKDTVIRHALDKMEFDSDKQGTFLPFSGPSIYEIEQGLRIKSVESNGNLYFVSSTGIKKISARTSADFPTTPIQEAGGVKALDVTAEPNYSSSGFLEANSKVAYRVVWGYKDANENLILGTPSARVVVYNVTATPCVVDLSFSIPADVTSTAYFYQVYRTGIFSAAMGQEAPDPGEEMNLVFEEQVTPSQLTAGIVTVTDITPEDFRRNGTFLYINPTSGEGIAAANEKPPFAKDLALYKGYVFYANTRTVQRLNLSFLSVTGLTSNVSTLTISDGVSTNTYTFQGSMESYEVGFTGCVHSDFINASPGPAKYFTITSANDERQYYVWFSETINDEDPVLSGMIGIKVELDPADTLTEIIDKMMLAVDDATTDFNLDAVADVVTIQCSNNGYVTINPTENITNGAFYISKDDLGTGEDIANNKVFLPRVPTGAENGPTTSQQLEQVATSLVRVITAKDNIVYAYYFSGFNDVPGQVTFEQRDSTGPAFYLTSNAPGTQFNPSLPASGTSVISTNEVRPNRVYYSKFQQPEAVPLANYIDIGPQDREIKRIIALRDSLFIFKEDGIYRLSGEVAPFTVAPFDFSAQVLSPDTAVVLNNQIYAFSTQGVIVVTDTGVSVISRPIENQLLRIIREGYDYKRASFGVSYETDRSYHLWTVSQMGDTVATQCFRYNTFTLSWTRWDISKTCGIVNFADDKMYLGAGDLNFVEKERKNLSRLDHADRDYPFQVELAGVEGTTLSVGTVNNVLVGDIFVQRQYLTEAQFNRMLIKLDGDSGVSDDNYFSTLEYAPGESMRLKLASLATKMDDDSGIAYSDFASDIGSYLYSASAIGVGNNAQLTIGPHNLKVGRYVSITNSDSTPSINGTYRVTAVGVNTINIDKAVLVAGTTADLQTAIEDFRDMQGCFNLMVNVLNLDSGAFYTNYPLSQDYTDFEGVVFAVNKLQNNVTLVQSYPFLFGAITLYKAIQTRVIWNPQFFGDPSVEKQVREGTLMFENTNFSKVSLGYATDRSPGFVDTEFTGAGNGAWGAFAWGGINWGGIAAPTPIRTYIPQQKQRCRFINVKFEHRVAYEKYAIFGISLTFRPYNIRTAR